MPGARPYPRHERAFLSVGDAQAGQVAAEMSTGRAGGDTS